MTTPNINDATKNITGYHTGVAVGTTETALIDNAASSGKLMRVAGVYVSNIDGTNTANVTIKLYDQGSLGGTAVHLAKDMPVPAGTTLLVLNKDAPIYLREGSSIGITASADGDLESVITYEEIA